MSAKYMFRYIHWIENVSYMLLFSLGYNPYSCVSVKIAIELYKQAEESDAYVSDFGVADKSAWVIQKKSIWNFSLGLPCSHETYIVLLKWHANMNCHQGQGTTLNQEKKES